MQRAAGCKQLLFILDQSWALSFPYTLQTGCLQNESIARSHNTTSLTIRGHAFGITDRPQPAVILSHGFLANERMCFKYAKSLAGMGFLAITFDFCGGGIISRSDGRSQNMTILTEKADLLTVVEGVKNQFSPTSITLLGCSQGGFVSGLLAAELGTEEIDRLIMFYPAVCIPGDARKGRMMFYKFDPDNIPTVLGRFPMKLGGEYARTVIVNCWLFYILEFTNSSQKN